MQPFKKIFSSQASRRLSEALREDIGNGDITSRLLIPRHRKAQAVIIAKEKGIVCGLPVLNELFRKMDARVKIRFLIQEGSLVTKGKTILRITGNLGAILKVERTALNFLGHLSGIATKTREYVRKAGRAAIYDTRKTHPLLREFEKYAVRIGGGHNHRMGLYDAVFVKENHKTCGNLKKLKTLKKPFEIEVRNQKELEEALTLKPSVILFDNYRISALKQAVQFTRHRNKKVKLEASGGVRLKNVSRYATTGVNQISVGELTHSVKSMDFSLLVKA